MKKTNNGCHEQCRKIELIEICHLEQNKRYCKYHQRLKTRLFNKLPTIAAPYYLYLCPPTIENCHPSKTKAHDDAACSFGGMRGHMKHEPSEQRYPALLWGLALIADILDCRDSMGALNKWDENKPTKQPTNQSIVRDLFQTHRLGQHFSNGSHFISN